MRKAFAHFWASAFRQPHIVVVGECTSAVRMHKLPGRVMRATHFDGLGNVTRHYRADASQRSLACFVDMPYT